MLLLLPHRKLKQHLPRRLPGRQGTANPGVPESLQTRVMGQAYQVQANQLEVVSITDLLETPRSH